MSTPILVDPPNSPPPTPPASAVPAAAARTAVVIDEKVFLPSWVVDLDSYRQWAHSDQYPERGWISFLDGKIWVDLSMEELLTHNNVKMAFAFEIMAVLSRTDAGQFVGDRMLLSNAMANLATEPDGMAYLWSTMQTGRLIPKPGKSRGYMELVGTPDIVLEVVSASSVRKDTIELRENYWKAGIPEYWLANALGESPNFEILHRNDDGYASLEPAIDWQTSRVLNHQFRLLSNANPIGQIRYAVESRPVS